MTEDGKEIVIYGGLVIFFGLAIWALVTQNQGVQPPLPQPTNATVIINYYCESTPEPAVSGIPPHNITFHGTRDAANENSTPVSPTPALWNDTRRESVGLPADGYKNPCCKHCTPTPTPTGTPVSEFPCPMRSGC